MSSRELLPFVAPDLSAFARALGQGLKSRAGAEPPGHVELLNLIARAAGHRNLQALRAAGLPPPPPATAPEDWPPPAPLSDNARKALMQFDSHGRLVRWPVKYSVQRLAMWVLWTLFDGRRLYTEREVNAILKAANAFGVRTGRIMTRHIFPNVVHLIIITTVLDFSALILYEAVLSYVGVGVDPSMNSFGGMINLARTEMSRDPLVWWSFAAAFTFMVTLVLAANLFADGVRDAFDPRARSFRPRLHKGAAA